MPTAARIQIFDGPDRPFRNGSLELPSRLNPGEVLVEISLATICGSDLHTLAGHRREPAPSILGHEAVGLVAACGSDRENIHPGDRITWSIADSCGTCVACTDHNLPQKCRSLFKYGHAKLNDGCGLNGCYASHILLRAGTHIVTVPSDIEDAVAASANCALSTVFNAVSHLPRPCSVAVVQGAGLLGIYACAVMAEMGIERIFCTDVDATRLSRVKDFGALPIYNRDSCAAEALSAITKAAPQGADAVLEMAGTANVIPQGLKLLRPGGTYILVGMVHPNSALELTGEQIIRKCLTIRGVHNYNPRHLDEAISFLHHNTGQYPFASLTGPTQPLDKLEYAVDLARRRRFLRIPVQP